ncbi:MAG: ABC transporter permease [Methanosarcinales archaeon]|nr:MAG: ABC transporter permease [Methanosarcinales archaeon]
MMHKTLVVAKHEFLATVKTKGFILSLILPFVILLPVMFTSGYVMQIATQSPQNIGFVDETGILQPDGVFTRFEDVGDAKNALLNDEINSFLTIPPDYLETGRVVMYGTGGFFSSAPTGLVEAFMINNLLRDSGVDEAMGDRIRCPVEVEQITLDESGEVEEKQEVRFLIPYVVAILMMLSIMTTSGYLMQGIVAEKENKTVEILLSSLSPEELLTGKLIGFGSAGLLQMCVWICSGTLMISLTSLTAVFQEIQISLIMILAIPYFILGYLLFAGSMACVAAPASTMKDAQQGAMIFTMLGILPIMLLGVIIAAPDSVVARVLTYIPYTAPATTLMRITLTSVSVYEIAASLLILTVSVIVVIKLSARIFRSAILMSGKKIRIRDIPGYLKR